MSKSRIIRYSEIVRYTVQEGDRLDKILKKSAMSGEMFRGMNDYRQNEKVKLRKGDEILLRDPMVSCEREEALVRAMTEFVSPHWINFRCEQVYASFKPLRAFTKPLQKDGE